MRLLADQLVELEVVDAISYQTVRVALVKSAPGERRSDDELEHAIRQIISKAVVSDEVVDIFSAAGLKKPDISILSDEFLAEVRGLPQRILAVELLIDVSSQEPCEQVQGLAELLDGPRPFRTPWGDDWATRYKHTDRQY